MIRPIEKLDQFINKRFSSSFMNDTKWEKLIDNLTFEIDRIYVNYKLIYNDNIDFTYFQYQSDYKPFFIEPILYKEVEWIEFPKEYEKSKKIYQKGDLIKGVKEKVKQDITEIEKIITKTGEFLTEKDANSLKLFGYR